jgi:hypothetical protein
MTLSSTAQKVIEFLILWHAKQDWQKKSFSALKIYEFLSD